MRLNANINSLDIKKKKITYALNKVKKTDTFDILVNTIPVLEFIKFTKGLTQRYVNKIKKLRYVSVVGLCFGTKSFLDSYNYWVNFFDEHIHVLYQHSLLIDKYNSKISWCVRYGRSEEDFPKSDEEIKKIYLGVLKQYFPSTRVNWCYVFRERYAEPIYDKDYASYAPTYRTDISCLYNSGIQVTFPKIRNMDVALESGITVANYIEADLH